MNNRKIFSLTIQRITILFIICCLWFNNSVAFALDLNSNGQYLSPTCENIKDWQLKSELQTIIDNYFTNPNTFQVSKIVETDWQTLGINQKIDNAISLAITQVRKQGNGWDKFSSNWDQNKAEKFTETIINTAINSDELKRYLESLSIRISNQISRDLELAVSESSQQGVKCLQQYIGNKYTEVFVTPFSDNIQQPDLDSLKKVSPKVKSFVSSQSLALSGLTLIVVAQVGKRIANQVAKRVLVQLGERLLGRIGTAVIPLIGEIAGGVLLVVDVANSMDGVLPEIEKEFKKPELKDAIKQEYINTVSSVIKQQSPDITIAITNELYSQWLDFKRRYQEALEFARISPEFSIILEKNKSQLDKVALLLTSCQYEMGTNEILEIVSNGKFEEALTLPETSFVILSGHQIDYLLDYRKLAGNKLDQVVQLEIYKHIAPDQLDRNLLNKILKIEDTTTIQRISLLDMSEIKTLLKISTENLIEISARLTPDDLSNLAQNIANLKQSDANSVIRLLLSDNRLMSNLKYLPDLVKSNNIQDAIALWENDNCLFSVFSAVMGMITFKIGWHFIADKFGISLAVLIAIIVVIVIVMGLIAFLVLRLLFAKMNYSTVSNKS
jgi:hypothetical protein